MNTYPKSILLLVLIVLASGQDLQQRITNLRGALQTAQANNAANLATLDAMMQQLQNSANLTNVVQNNSSQNQPNSTPANNNAAPVANNSSASNNAVPVANNSTPVNNDSTPVANNASSNQTEDNVTPSQNSNDSASNDNASATNNGSTNGNDLFTLDQLEQIMPNSGNNSAYYYSYLNSAMTNGNITNCPRMAAFLAQIGHESGSLVYTTEIADGSEYEGIADIGNTEPGDGVKYKGRGLIQVTGKYNYEIVGEGLGYDFVDNPTALAEVPWCVTSAVWWWNNHSLSAIADANTQASFDQTTRIINGGYNGKADRDSRWATAKQVLGCA